MSGSTKAHAHPHDGAPRGVHVVPVWLLAAVLGALLVLTVATVAVTWVDLGAANLWIAMAIAVFKGSLVALYFMHLRWERATNAMFFIGSLLFVMLFVGLALMDTGSYQEEMIPDYAPAIER
jgi:cytochrome c oxidase subunit 4